MGRLLTKVCEFVTSVVLIPFNPGSILKSLVRANKAFEWVDVDSPVVLV